jgi:sugar phosphate permease
MAAAFVALFLAGPGQTYSYALFINSIIDDTGWTRSTISTLYSAATTVSGLLMMIVGRLVDKFGSRLITLIAIICLGVTCFFSSFIVNPMMLWTAFFLGRFFGQGTLGVATSVVAPQWFLKRRALAIMIVGLGNTFAAMTMPKINQWLISTYGWRAAFRYLGIGVWVIGLPIIFFFLRSKPEDIGLLPDGAVAQSEPRATDEGAEEVSFTQRQAIRTPAFWILAFVFFQFAVVQTGITFHFVSILNGAGFSESFAATVMSISPLSGLTATILIGTLMDRFKKPQRALFFGCLGQVAAVIMLVFMSREPFAYLYSVLTGSSVAILMLSVNVLKPYLFGRGFIGGISGALTVVSVVGSAIGPLYFGIAYDATGGYSGTLLISAVLPAIAAVLALFVRHPKTVDG